MSQLLKNCHDKLLLAFALALLAASSTWVWRQQGDVRRLRAWPVALHPAGPAYEPAGLRLPEPVTAVWPRPAAQSGGSDWLYEVFTPPVIHYNALDRSFTVAPPGFAAEGGASFGLKLLAVKPEPYRLQLVGYFGGPGDYLAAFTNPDLPETLLARPGRRFDTLGLTFRSLEVKKVPVAHVDPWPVYDVAAFAVLRDDRTGADVVLDSRTRKFTGAPLAVLRLPAGDGQPRALHEGDRFTDGASSYRIERIQLDPPEVVVAWQPPSLLRSETRVLHPVDEDGERFTDTSAKTLPERPSAGFAANKR